MKNEKVPDSQGDIIIYQTEDGVTKIDVRFVDETVWLTQAQLALLFQTSRTNVVEHIKNIYQLNQQGRYRYQLVLVCVL